MTTADSVAPSAVALRLVVTAERLFAQRGIDGVSLRQIASEAGSGNNSAVHYHFGSKHGLVNAIFQYRLPQIISERRLLLARCDLDDLRARFEAHFLPVLALAEAPDNHYVSFIEQLQRHERGAADGMLELPPDGERSTEEFRRDLDRLLDALPEPLRRMRIDQAQSLCIHAAADRERAVTSGLASVPFDLFVNSLFDGIAGFLAAPESDATRRRLDQAADAVADEPELRSLRPN